MSSPRNLYKPYPRTVVKLNHDCDVHMMPMEDWFEHRPDLNCECRPFECLEAKRKFENEETAVRVWNHRQIKYNKDRQN